jgi:hypothetical protein
MGKVYLGEDGFVHEILDPTVTVEGLRSNLRELHKLERQLREEGRPFNILLDASRVRGDVGYEVRREGLRSLDQIPYRRIAILGCSGYLKRLAMFMLVATGKDDRIKCCDSREEAEAWLGEGDQAFI